MSNLPRIKSELLAPAGDREAMDAALEAGADAVYFGLSSLNARRRAKNFQPEQLADTVEAVHSHDARAYLTLNIDLAERNVGQAARMLELARQSHVDAILVRDPALLALRSEYPELEFHFSTQTCMANSADVAAAGRLGASRVVLARELSLREIAAASAVPDVQTEVFIQGALCFSVSGRCLLSSWIGGHSGNRGTCTSPCRVPWTADEEPIGTPFSMRDLAALERLGDLHRAGVTALKIEGRLKNPDWVRRAVELYRRALNGEFVSLADAAALGAYTGRMLTCGYLDGRRDELTGSFGRERSTQPPVAKQECDEKQPDDENQFGEEKDAAFSTDLQDESNEDSCQNSVENEENDAVACSDDSYDLDIMITDRAIEFHCHCGGQTFVWTTPKTVIHRPNKAVSVADVFHWLDEMPIQGKRLGEAVTNDPAFLLVRRATSALSDRISASLRQVRKPADDQVRIELPPTVRERLEKRPPAPSNTRILGDSPNRARLETSTVAAFVQKVQPSAVILEGLTARKIETMQSTCGNMPFVAALPSIFFEDEIPGIRELLTECAKAKIPVEVNSWGGWLLSQQAGVVMEAGPGLAVLNALAARQLASLGLRCVTLSPEADRRQLEELTSRCDVPCSLVVFSRPALFTTRVNLPENEIAGKVLADRRGARLIPRRERGLWMFRPADPFDLRDCRNERIHAHHLVVDLVGSNDPVGEWRQQTEQGSAFHFNYDRTLA